MLALSLSIPVAAQSPLCTPTPPTWASNNGGTAGGVVFYDLTASTSVIISGFDCNLSATAPTSVTLELYTKAGTYSGFETNSGAWTLVGSAGPVISSARESATSFTLASPVILPAGLTGVGYRVIGSGQAYNGTGTGAQVTTSTSELSLTSGAAISGLFTGSFFSFRNWNGCIHYTPADGLFSSFTATPTTGASPLNVQFTDTTFTSDPNGVQSWAWDLDGDSIVDSTLQNPSFLYSTPGFYTVSLTSSNSCFGDSETKTNFINVVGATVNTQSAEILEYQFNEVRGTTVANVASTTIAPPAGTIAQTGWQTNAGRPFFQGNEAGFGCLAIDNVTPYDNYVATGWPLSIQGSHTIMFWMRHGGVTGTAYPFGVASTPTSARCWKSGTTMNLLSWGQVPSTPTATQPSTLVGWQHWCIVIDDANGTAQWYLNGVADGNQTVFTAGTFNLLGGQFLVGSYSSSRTNNITRFFDMDDFRFYSRALTAAEIQTESAAENPTTAEMEAGCTDSNNFSPRLEANGAPQIGNLAFGLTASGLEPNTPTAIYVGLGAYLGGFLPLDLAGTGVFNTGCNLLVSPDIIINFSSGSGTVFLPSPIPIDPTLQGGHAYNQLVNVGSGPLYAVSNAIDTQMQF